MRSTVLALAGTLVACRPATPVQAPEEAPVMVEPTEVAPPRTIATPGPQASRVEATAPSASENGAPDDTRDGEARAAVPALWRPGSPGRDAIPSSPPPPRKRGQKIAVVDLPPPIVAIVTVPLELTTVAPTPGVAVVERCRTRGSDAAPTATLVQSSRDPAVDHALLHEPMRRPAVEPSETEPRCALASKIVLPAVADADAEAAPVEPIRLASPTLIEASRVAGERVIMPAGIVAAEIGGSGQRRLTIPVRLCIDPDGRVDEVTLVRSSGYLAYDLDLINGVAAWRYRPLVIADKAVRACAFVNFVYIQADAPA